MISDWSSTKKRCGDCPRNGVVRNDDDDDGKPPSSPSSNRPLLCPISLSLSMAMAYLIVVSTASNSGFHLSRKADRFPLFVTVHWGISSQYNIHLKNPNTKGDDCLSLSLGRLVAWPHAHPADAVAPIRDQIII